MSIDNKSWQVLKNKALKHFLDHREGQLKQGFFNQLNEAFAYRYLVNKGFDSVKFIKECGQRRPDIEFMINGVSAYCEVKTIGISDDEIKRRHERNAYDGSVYVSLSDGFLRKFNDAVLTAQRQICSMPAKGLVYIIIRPDDFTMSCYKTYRHQLITFAESRGFRNLFIKIELLGNKRICLK